MVPSHKHNYSTSKETAINVKIISRFIGFIWAIRRNANNIKRKRVDRKCQKIAGLKQKQSKMSRLTIKDKYNFQGTLNGTSILTDTL